MTSLLIIFISLLSIKLVKADPIVGSDYDENSDYRIEMTVFKKPDTDPNYDYYLVKVFTRDKYGPTDWILWYSKQFVKIFCYTPTAEKIESERRPSPGTYYSDTTITFTYAGVSIPIRLVKGTVTTSYWHATYGDTQSYSWTYTAALFSSGIDTEMTYILGYRVQQGYGLTVAAYTQGEWKVWIWAVHHRGTSPIVVVSV